MSRPMVLCFLLLVLIITSQFEWRQPLVSDADATPGESQKLQQITEREESVKEKIILSQEKNIHMLNELVRVLKNNFNFAAVITRHPTALSARKRKKMLNGALTGQQILEETEKLQT